MRLPLILALLVLAAPAQAEQISDLRLNCDGIDTHYPPCQSCASL